ncbi:MAG TPA: glycosyltransferase family 39 protein [Patescibacteria group bacterium]|nr:glycosyltransferase family 39 protein [Patescibacteria group bacterium]
MKFFNLANKKLIILLFIFLVAFILRFGDVTKVPPSLYWDEVSQGYNAYSVLTTGYDEHHNLLPLADFVAFGDNKAPVNIYFIALSMIFLGKTTLAIRFPSILLGSLTVVCAYFLVREVFWQHKKRDILALVVSGLLAISPWHILLSRASYEANIATFFTVLGLFLFFLAKRKYGWIYIFSSISLVVGFYSFNAQRVFIPLIVFSLIVLYWRDLLKTKKMIFLSAVVGAILLIPMFFYLLNPDSRTRFAEVNIFSDSGVVNQSNTWLSEDNNSLTGKIFDNRRVGYTFLYLKHYFDFFNPQYLFFTGDVDTRFSSQASGELWLWELPFILIGFFALFKMKNRTTWFVFLWFLLAPVAAATARETPHALRSETYIPIYEMIAGLGLVTAYLFLKEQKRIFFYTVFSFVFLVAIFEGVYLWHEYFTTYPIKNSYDWQYGYSQAIAKTEKLQKNFDMIAFTDTYGRAYVYYLFYANVSPQTYWKEGNPTADVFGLYNVTRVGKYNFRGGIIEQSSDPKRTLYVASESQLKPDLRVIDRVNFLNGDPAFLLAVKK